MLDCDAGDLLEAPSGCNQEDVIQVLLGVSIIEAVFGIIDDGEKVREHMWGGVKIVEEHDGI